MANLAKISRSLIDGSGVQHAWIPSGSAVLGGVAVDAAHVYWSQIGVGINRAALDGSAREIAWIASADELFACHVDATHIYWADFTNSCIGRAKLDGSEVEPAWVGPLAHPPVDLAIGPEHIYVLLDGLASIARVKLDGTELREAWLEEESGEQVTGFAIAISGANLYVSSPGIKRIPVSGAAVEAWTATNSIGICADASNVYAIVEGEGSDNHKRTIVKLDLATKEATTLVGPEEGIFIQGLAVDGEHLYWTAEVEGGSEGGSGAIWTPDEFGSPPEPVGGGGGVGNPFTYPAWDLLTMEALDPLPYIGVSFGEEVNRPGSWGGQLPIDDPRVQRLDYIGASNTGRTALFVDLNGTLVWGGVIWTRRYKESAKMIVVGAMEFGSYFAQRLQAKDYATTWEGGEHTEDPMVIAKTIVEDAQNRPPEVDVAPGKIVGGITIIINGGPAPAIEASYPGTQLQTIESIVSTLSQMGYEAGFDYSFDVAYVTGTKTPAVTLNFWFPRQGRLQPDSGLIVLARDCVDWDWDEDSTRQATSVTETGTGSGGLQPATSSAAPPGYPLLERAVSHSQVNNEGVLAAIALGDLALTVFPVTTPQLVLPVQMPGPEASERGIAFGDFRLGDDLSFRVEPQNGPGLNKSPRFPKGCAFDWRITNWQCAVADKGLSTITFNLTIPPINEIPPPQPPLK